MKQIAEDWRVHAMATLAKDMPSAFPGGPAHQKGAHVAMLSVSRLPNGQSLSYIAPGAVALALNIAAIAAKKAVEIRPTESSPIPSPTGPTAIIHDNSALFDYFEQCFIAASFSFQALEAYANYKIGYKLEGDFEITKKGKHTRLTKQQVERSLSTEEKLSIVLPKILKVPTPKGTPIWEKFLRLKDLRDSTIHIKSHHQWTSGDQYDESPYSFFLVESILDLPLDAVNIIEHFSGDPEKSWLTGARTALQ